MTTLYSFVVKRLVLFDIIFLASLYTIRILAGGTATGVPVSEWFLAFSLFFFLSLALVKRFSELAELRKSKVDKAHGRGYLPVDLELISSMGAASGYISILVLALYIHNEKSAELYRYPELIWLLCPLILYWISRVWLLAHRGEMHEDPIVFAIKDKVSYFTGIIALAIMGFAI